MKNACHVFIQRCLICSVIVYPVFLGGIADFNVWILKIFAARSRESSHDCRAGGFEENREGKKIGAVQSGNRFGVSESEFESLK